MAGMRERKIFSATQIPRRGCVNIASLLSWLLLAAITGFTEPPGEKYALPLDLEAKLPFNRRGVELTD